MCIVGNLCVWSLTLGPSQIRGFPLRCISRRQLRAVLRSGRSVDAQRPAGGHAGYRGNGPAEA